MDSEKQRTYVKLALPTDSVILVHLGRPPKAETKTWEGNPRQRLTFMFQVADRRYGHLLKQTVFETVNAAIGTGKDGKRPTGAYQLLESMAGRALGPEWKYVDGSSMTEEQWAPWLGYYAVWMDEPEYSPDGKVKSQRTRAVFNPRLIRFPVETWAVDLSDRAACEEAMYDCRDAARAILGSPAGRQLPMEMVLDRIRQFMDLGNGYRGLARALVSARQVDRVSALPEEDLRRLHTLMLIHGHETRDEQRDQLVKTFLADRSLVQVNQVEADALLLQLNRLNAQLL